MPPCPSNENGGDWPSSPMPGFYEPFVPTGHYRHAAHAGRRRDAYARAESTDRGRLFAYVVLPSDMVDNSITLSKPISGWFIRSGQINRPSLPRVRLHLSASASSFTHSPRHETAPPLACEPLKRKAAARGTRALPELSIVDVSCLLPWLESVAGSVALAVCPLVREAA